MQSFTRQHKLGLFQAEMIDKVGIVIKLATVGGAGWAPFWIGGNQRQAQRQRAQKRLVQNQAGTGCCQFGFYFRFKLELL